MKKHKLLKTTALTLITCAGAIALNGYTEEHEAFVQVEVVPSCLDVCLIEKAGKSDRSKRACPMICEAREEFCANKGGTYMFEAKQSVYVCQHAENFVLN